MDIKKLTAIEYNEFCKEQLKKLEPYELIESVVFEPGQIGELATKISMYFSRISNLMAVREFVTIFMVGCAKYTYNLKGEGEFWPNVEALIGRSISTSLRDDLLVVFSTTLKQYKLAGATDVHKQKNIGAYLHHAGIPYGLRAHFFNCVQTLHNQDIRYDDIYDEMLYASRYSSPYVQSYIETLEENGLLENYVIEMFEILDNRHAKVVELPIFLHATFSAWLEEQEKTASYTKERNLRRPVISYDENSNLISLETPELTLPSSYDYVVWQVNQGEEIVSRRRVYGVAKEDKTVIRPTAIPLSEIKNLTVFRLNEFDEEEDKFELTGEENIILFNKKGVEIKNKKVIAPNEIIAIDSQYITSNADVEYRTTIGAFSIYKLHETQCDEIVFSSFLGTHTLYVKKKFEIINGKSLITDMCSFDNYAAYCELPTIIIPASGKIDIAISCDNNKIIQEEDIETLAVDLDDYVNGKYGVLSIRIHHETLGYKTFKLLYLPQVATKFLNNYPQEDGYTDAKIVFGVQDGYIIDEGMKKIKEMIVPASQEMVRGGYVYNDRIYRFSLPVRPYVWQLESNQTQIGLTNSHLYLSTKDMQNNGNHTLFFKNNTSEAVYVVINNNVGVDRHWTKVAPFAKAIIVINEHMEYINLAEGYANIYIEQDWNKICELATIKKEIIIRDFCYYDFEDKYLFAWQEDGSCKNRKAYFRNLYRPYEGFYVDIEDGALNFSIDTNDGRIRNCIVEIVQEEEENLFDMVETKAIPVLENSVVINIEDKESEIVPFDNNDNLETLKNVVFYYLHLIANEYKCRVWMNDRRCTYEMVLEQIEEYLLRYRVKNGDAPVLNEIFTYDIDQQIFDRIVDDFKMYVPIIRDTCDMNRNTFAKLYNKNMFLYFVYAVLKKDQEHLSRILDNLQGFIFKFRDTKNINHEKPDIIFPHILSDPEIRQYLLSKRGKDTQSDVVHLIDYFLSSIFEFSNDQVLFFKDAVKENSDRIKTIYKQYPQTLAGRFLHIANRHIK